MLESQHGRRVVITGIGVVAPCGIGAADYWAGLTKQPEPAQVSGLPEVLSVTRPG